MKKRYSSSILSLILLLSTFAEIAPAQIFKPVKWTFSSKSINGDEAELIISAKIDKGWHLYSQHIPEGGPIATSFKFTGSPDYKLLGEVEEPEATTVNDPNFEMELKYFSKKAVFKQKIKRLSLEAFEIKGLLEFMVCDEEKCLPPEEIEFTIKIPKLDKTELSGEPIIRDQDSLKNNITEMASGDDTITTKKKVEGLDISVITEVKEKKLSIWAIFIGGFLGGLLALLTPCVFPMIPLTVSFFTKHSKTREKGIFNACLYGISIILIYVGFGLFITGLLGPDALNALASNVIMNMIFFIVFVVFAFSFLGAFEITLPSSWINKADGASEKGGIIGIFFMAFTLSLVSFSCTGPIIGTLLVEAAVGGNYLGPFMGMAGFSVALALPFTLFALFPGWLNSLPKSGGWLNSVKVVLGFLELALALKFLSNVDLAYSWGMLTREIFLAIWIIIFALLGFYLLGKLKFPHDSDVKHISITRLVFAILSFAFVIYLVPGMFGAPLKLISGFPPPLFYNEGWSLNSAGTSSKESNIIEGVDRTHCPHNLPCFHDYDLALAHARKSGKPLMVDFTGWSCVNCRKMEDKVWIDPRVLKILENDYVLVSLYVDDKTDLPAGEQRVSDITGKKIKTTGNKWSDLQTSRFKTNSQPYYVLLDHNENLLAQPRGYDPDIELYLDFLNGGLKVFGERKR